MGILADAAPAVHPAPYVCTCGDCPLCDDAHAKAVGLAIAAEPFDVWYDRLLLAAERRGWEGGDLDLPGGLSGSQAEGIEDAWCDGHRQRQQDEREMAQEKGGAPW